MTAAAAFDVVLAFCPVVAFLGALLLMDSFRLVRPASVALAIGYGAAAAVGCLSVNHYLLQSLHVPSSVVTRYAAPIIEESAKALLVVALIATGRVAFLVDVAVEGFAVGTGFALVENLNYLRAMPDASILVWVVRGLGTAVLQGAATAIFGMVFKALIERRSDRTWLALLPGWSAAVVLHSLFNHRLLPPVAQTLLILVVMPLATLWAYSRSERATREWIGAGLDLDIELLGLVSSEAFTVTRFGQYLQQLRGRFPGSTIADMYCLLRLELELSVQAKAMLLAREAALDVPVDEDLAAVLAEREFLQRSIGRAGLLALKPLQVTGRRDQWHRHILRQRLRVASPSDSGLRSSS
jgi:RsiW-degrading membrane proteinase PrsW (M82 family)